MGPVITRLLEINPECLEPDRYDRIVKVLAADGVMVYPTDTFYGLGSNCYSVPALDRIYELKKREASKALLVVAADRAMAARVTRQAPPVFAELASRFWPGPLTLVLEAGPSLPRRLLGDGDSIAVRVPGLAWLRALIRQAGFPLVATSANLSGEPEVSTAAEARAIFNGRVDIVVDGGPTTGLKPSTVVDLTGPKPRLVRDGALPRSALASYL